jgi:hypothetical protein
LRILYPSIRIKLQDLQIPPVIRDFTGQSVHFLTLIYCYSLLAYLPDLLGAIENLENAGFDLPIPCLCRNFLEWTACACYLSNKLDAYKVDNDNAQMIKTLERLLVGNRWVSRQDKTAGVPDPIRTDKLINDYFLRSEDDFGDADAKDDYGMLCELTHANGMALGHYQKLIGSEIIFDRDETPGFSNRINMDLISILMFLYNSLNIVEEKIVSSQLSPILKSIVAENNQPAQF